MLGQRCTVVLGVGLMAVGHFMMAFGPLFLLALFTLILGNGAFKPNIFLYRICLSDPLFGGWLADHMLGQRCTVVLGAGLMAVGHFMMAFGPLFLLALFTLILGHGAFKPNISTQVGGLYARVTIGATAPIRSSTWASMSARSSRPLICGTLGRGVGMTIALAFYLYASPMLPPDEMHKAKAAELDKILSTATNGAPADRVVSANHDVLGHLRAAGQHTIARAGRRMATAVSLPPAIAPGREKACSLSFSVLLGIWLGLGVVGLVATANVGACPASYCRV